MFSKVARIVASIVLAVAFFSQAALPGAGVTPAQATAPRLTQWLQNNTSYIPWQDSVYDAHIGGTVSQSADGITYAAAADNETVNNHAGQGEVYAYNQYGINFLTASDGAAGDHFGISVSVSGDGSTILVGAYMADVNGHTHQGAAYVYVLDSQGIMFIQQQKLVLGSASANQYFGVSVALSNNGSTALIGANGYTGTQTLQGAAYVYTRSGTTWSKQTASPLIASDPAANDCLGNAAALSSDGNTALVGASGKASNRGAAYTFTRGLGGTWSIQQKFLAWDGAAGDDFGRSVSLSSTGGKVLIGADNAKVGTQATQGAAYTFTHSMFGWVNGVKLFDEDGAVNDWFGYSVSLSGDGSTAVIGAPMETINGYAVEGAGYVFFGDQFSQVQKLAASDGRPGSDIGRGASVNADGSLILLGAPYLTWIGTVYRFDRYSSDWWQSQMIDSPSGPQNALLGNALAISADGNIAAIGSGADWGGGMDQVLIYTRWLGQWRLRDTIHTPDANGNYQNSFGLAVALSANGNTLLVGNYKATIGVNTLQGVAYVMSYNGSTWSTPTKLLKPAGAAPKDQFGYSVALSGDGNTAVIGANMEGSWLGGVYVMTRSGGVWSGLTQVKAVETPPMYSKFFGSSVALNNDGSTLLVGATNSVNAGSTLTGAAYVFTRSAGVYSQQAKLAPNYASYFGDSVALSSDGSTAAIGGPCSICTAGTGLAFVYVRSGTTWSKQAEFGAVDYPEDADLYPDRFGDAVALSSNGSTLVVGASFTMGYGKVQRGAAYVYTRSGTAWTPQAKLIAADSYQDTWCADALAVSANADTILFDADAKNAYKGGVYFYTTQNANYPMFLPITRK